VHLSDMTSLETARPYAYEQLIFTVKKMTLQLLLTMPMIQNKASVKNDGMG